jgi:hypothetical protein
LRNHSEEGEESWIEERSMKEVKEREKEKELEKRYKYAKGKVPMAKRERDKVLGERNIKIMTQIQTDTVKTNEL